MQTKSTFTDAGWDFVNTWAISPSANDGYPYLISSIVNNLDNGDDSSIGGGTNVLMGQSFINGNVYLNLESITLSMDYGFISDIEVKLYSANGSEEMGTLLASMGTGVLVSGTLYKFSPTSPVLLAPSTRYWIVFYSTDNAYAFVTTNDIGYSGFGMIPTTKTFYDGTVPEYGNGQPWLFEVKGSATSISTWTGSLSTNWNTSGNWSPEVVPTSSKSVVIPFRRNQPIVNEAVGTPATCSELSIETSAILTIATNKALTVNGNLLNSAGTTGLVVKSDGTGTGSLKIVGSTSGSATVERIMEPAKWHIVSAPAIENLSTFLARNKAIPASSLDATILGMKDYHTAGNSWNGSYTTSTSGMMDVGKGYLVRTEQLTTETTILDFKGVLHAGDKNVEVVLSGSNGWNAIGNPYTSAIKLSDGTVDASGLDNFLDVNKNKMDAVNFGAYVYTAAGTNNGYTVINYTTAETDRYAALGQGFFVKAVTNGDNIKFTPAMQLHKDLTAAPFKAAANPIPSIKLTVKNSVATASTELLFIDGTTKGLDIGYDAGILKADPSFALYTKLVEPFDAEFQLQCLPTNQYNNLVIPIGIDSKSAGEIVFSVETVQLAQDCNVILEDKLTNTFTDLSKGSYKTTVVSNTSTSERFFLHTGDIISGLEDQVLPEKLTAYVRGNTEIRVIGEVSEGAVATLYNGLGQVVLTKKLGAGTLNIIVLPNLSSGLYLLSIDNNGTPQTIKIMVRK